MRAAARKSRLSDCGYLRIRQQSCFRRVGPDEEKIERHARLVANVIPESLIGPRCMGGGLAVAGEGQPLHTLFVRLSGQAHGKLTIYMTR